MRRLAKRFCRASLSVNSLTTFADAPEEHRIHCSAPNKR